MLKSIFYWSLTTPVLLWRRLSIPYLPGYKMITATDGVEALEAFEREQPDLILCWT